MRISCLQNKQTKETCTLLWDGSNKSIACSWVFRPICGLQVQAGNANRRLTSMSQRDEMGSQDQSVLERQAGDGWQDQSMSL